jgi:hypothetical protein
MRTTHPLPLLALALLTACAGPAPDERPADAAQEPAPITANPLAAPAEPPRYDGVYAGYFGGTVQLLRFFPEGNVVTATDRASGGDSLRLVLRADLQPDLGKGLHNVPVTFRNDSILFRTTIMRGFIDYGGVQLGPDSMRLLKHSTATAKSALLTYRFVPDGTPLPKE